MSLFKPLKVGKLELKHRVVLAPLTRLRAPAHQPTELQAEYYDQRSSRPGTLIITEATSINRAAGGLPDVPGIWSKEQVDGWKPTFKAIHKNNSFVFVQLWALGYQAKPSGVDEGIQVVSAVDGEQSGFKVHGLTKAEIKEYVQWFVEAAKNAIEAGADGVEIHSANGYLLDQFLHSNSNSRTDEYGGSIENRARFTLEVVDAVTEALGPERVAIRLSPWFVSDNITPAITGSSPIPQFSYVVAQLQARADAGKPLAYLSTIEPGTAAKATDRTYDIASKKNGFVREIWQGPLVVAGGLTDVAEEIADSDENTLVGLGRYFISNPDIVNRLEKNIPLTKYNRATFYTPGPVGYTDYPFATSEND